LLAASKRPPQRKPSGQKKRHRTRDQEGRPSGFLRAKLPEIESILGFPDAGPKLQRAIPGSTYAHGIKDPAGHAGGNLMFMDGPGGEVKVFPCQPGGSVVAATGPFRREPDGSCRQL